MKKWSIFDKKKHRQFPETPGLRQTIYYLRTRDLGKLGGRFFKKNDRKNDRQKSKIFVQGFCELLLSKAGEFSKSWLFCGHLGQISTKISEKGSRFQ